MSVKGFYFVLLSVLATVVALSSLWEFWLEDLLMSELVAYYEEESIQERWEFVLTASVFSFLALLAPAAIGAQILRRDRELRDMVLRLSQEDDLTGLFNRRRVTEILVNEIERASRYQSTFCLTFCDVDHFKTVNDQLGHQVGDKVLVGIARAIQSSVRSTDRVGRWGGEEFVILSPETELAGGLALAEKVRVRIASSDLGSSSPITASFGVAVYARDDDLETLIARADAALYAAKRAGRNRVEAIASSHRHPRPASMEANG